MIEQSRLDRLTAGVASVGFLFNPLSGRIRKRRAEMKRELGAVPNATCWEVTNALEIRASVEAFLEADIDLLVIVGGDGTVQGVLNHLFALQPGSKWPVLTIIPGGTTNMTALDLGIQGNPEYLLQKLCSCLLNKSSPVFVERHVLSIEQAGVPKVYGMFFGVGLIARAVIFSQGRIKRLGVTGEIYSAFIMLGYLAGVLLGRRNGAWAPARISVTHDSRESHHGTYSFLFASTLDRLLFGMRPYWGKEKEPVHVTFVKQQGKRSLRLIWPLLTGRGNVFREKNGYHSCNTRSLELVIDDDYIVDGESFRAAEKDGPLRITPAGPVCFLVADK
jgi:diacylglycerol kinase family enzyme